MTTAPYTPIPETGKKLYGLDHLRTLAIILVFIFHYGRLFPHPEWVNTISKFGWTGVDLFFVLSGYLISSQLFEKIARQEKIVFRVFFMKRFFRIIPAYLVVLALYFLFPLLREREGPAPLWKYLSFTQNLGLDLRTQGTFSHAWSLCIEEQFYLCLPLALLALVHGKRINKGFLLLLFLFLAGFGARLWSWHSLVAPFAAEEIFGIYWYKWIYYPTYCRLDSLLAGVSLAALFSFRPILKARIERYGNQILVLSLAVLAGAYYVCLEETSFGASVFGFPLVALGYGLMVLSAICPGSFLHRFKSGITARIATLSYALYLVHKIVIQVTQEYFPGFQQQQDTALTFLVCILTCLSAAFLLNKIVEKPFLKIRDRLLHRK